MIENTNRAIALNSFILYGKMVINTICALLTTRFALRALGVDDYGLFSVLGGIISLISIFNTIMLSTSNRFIAVAIGRGGIDDINKQFNVNLVIHILIALLALVVVWPIGNWYIPRYVNYNGHLSNAMMVYLVSVFGSIISFVGVPYNGLLMAKEKFIIFSLVDVICHIVKLVVAFLLIFHFNNKLLVYTLTMALLTAVPTVVYILYCNNKYHDLVKLHLVSDKHLYKQVFKFSSWVSVGAIASVGKTQGAALVVNTFFNTAMNAAMGVASSVNSYVTLFAYTVTQPMAPQITKNYASGNLARCDELLIMSTKYSFMLVFLLGSLFLVAPEWLLGLWLGDVPQYASVFLILFVIDNLVQAVNSGVSNYIFASGRIGMFQIAVSTLNLSSVVVGYLVLKRGEPAYYLMIAYIVVSVIKFFIIQIVLHITLNYNNWNLWKYSYLPSIMTFVFFLPVFFIPSYVHPALRLGTSFLYLCVLDYYVCLSKDERKRLVSFVKSSVGRYF